MPEISSQCDTSKTLVSSFTRYSVGVLFSRISGMFRDMALAFFFGATAEIALFMVAYRFANLMRRMLAESPLSSSFIPSFESHKNVSLKEGASFFRDLLVSFTIVVLGITLLSMGGMYGISSLFFKSQEMQEMMSLTQVMFPSLVFICLYGLCAAFLQCERRFFLPAAAPVMFNIVWIVSAYFANHTGGIGRGNAPMVILSYGVVIAFFMQWLVLMPKVIQLLLKVLSKQELFKWKVFNASLRPVVKPFLLGVLGVGATQINIALDGIFARVADREGPAFLWYAIRIEQVPIALFGVAISSVMLPALTRAIQRGESSYGWTVLKGSVQQTFSLMTFSMFGIFALGYEVIEILFARGMFQSHATIETTKCLIAYSVGLIPHGILLLLASVYYAHQDFKTPMKGALYAVFVNIILNAWMVYGLHVGAVSIALGTSMTSLFNCLYLRKYLKKFFQEKLVNWKFYSKTILCGMGSFGLIKGMLALIIVREGHLFKWALTGCMGIVYVAFYCILEKLLRCEGILNMVKTRFSK